MKVMQLQVGPIGTNCYIVYDEATKEGIAIDTGDSAKSILNAIEKENIDLKYILLTHGHFDHILATQEVKKQTGAKIVMHSDDKWLLKKEKMKPYRAFIKEYEEVTLDIEATEGTEIKFGNLTARYTHTPGHTPGSCTIIIENCLFTGDTMFRHECGRCDLEGGDFNLILKSLAKLANMQGDFQVLPGHEGLSTLSEERKYNPYVKQALAK